MNSDSNYSFTTLCLVVVGSLCLEMRLLSVHSHLGAGVTTNRRQFYFILFVLFFLFFCILFAFLRFGSDFRSHDSHVTREHMVELGAIFCCCFSARANSSSTYKDTYTYTVYLKRHFWCKYRKQYSGNKMLLSGFNLWNSQRA